MSNILDKAVTFGSFDVAVDDNSPAAIYSFVEEFWQFDYFHYVHHQKNLYVFFPSALMRGKRMIPSFHRWSWAPSFGDSDVLCVSDPTLRLDSEILGGWFQGKGDDWVFLRVLKHIFEISKKHNYQNILFCGSSLGGYAALQAGIIAPSIGFDENIRVYSENPQISLFRYVWQSHINKLANVSYGVDNIKNIPEKYASRLDIVKLINQFGHTPKGLIVVKESDTHHHLVHVRYLQENLVAPSPLRVEVIPSAVDSTGHTALSLDEMISRIGEIYG